MKCEEISRKCKLCIIQLAWNLRTMIKALALAILSVRKAVISYCQVVYNHGKEAKGCLQVCDGYKFDCRLLTGYYMLQTA